MEFRVRFYETADGGKPVAEFLNDLRRMSPALRQLVVNGLKELERRDQHAPPLTDRVQGTSDIHELRVGRTDIARVFFFFRPGQEIICTNGYVKKSQSLDPREVRRAERLKADWEARFSWPMPSPPDCRGRTTR